MLTLTITGYDRDDLQTPATIEKSVFVDRWGYLIVSEPLDVLEIRGDPYIVIPPDLVPVFGKKD